MFFLKNTSTKNTSHPWGVFVDRTFPLQKDFTPVGSFCRSVLQEKYGQQKDPTGVKCFSRTKTPSQKDPSTDFRNSRKVPDSPESDSQPRPIPCRWYGAYLPYMRKGGASTQRRGCGCSWCQSVLGENTSTKTLHTRGVFLLTVLFLNKKTSHPWGVLSKRYF